MTTREIAVTIWIIVLLILVFYFCIKKGIFKSVLDILISIWIVLKLPISQWVSVANIFYIVLIYYVTKNDIELSYWYIKDYVIIFLFTIFPAILLLKESSVVEIIRNQWRELLMFNTALLFISNTYTFSLPIELLLVFLLIILSIFSAVIDTKKELQQPGRLFSFLLSIVGLIMLLGALKQFLDNLSDIKSFDFWLSYAFELLVILINLPVLYIAQKMIIIEKIIVHSEYPNTIVSFM
ncbi:hypothetical protein, partial [Streptococcus pyogenes]